MGGGDLNLKKSWHPSTLRNIERVWKAEQKHEAEQKKIEQLQRELAEERAKEEMQNYAEHQGVVKKKEEKLDWMYQGPAALVDREQYLTGRQIDKTFEILEQHEKSNFAPASDNGCQIGSLFNQGMSTTQAPVDIANKIREDPLFMIRKQEEEKQKKLLTNPIKLKQLQEMLKNSLSSSKDKKKKRKKHKTRHSDNEDNRSGKRKHHAINGKKEKVHEKHSKRKKHSKQDYVQTESSDSDSSDHDNVKRKYTDKKHERRSIKSNRENGSYKSQHHELHIKKLSKEEMDCKRQEMMDNAIWREEQRQKNVQQYKEEEIKESVLSEKVKSKDFIKPMLLKAADSGTVEARIKQNIYNVQRNRGSMDTNFARR